MTEPYGYDENDTDDGNDDGSDQRYVQLTRQQIRALERDAKQARKNNDENAQLKRELALSRAGLGDLSAARQKALLANIDGDITADAARAAAEELGFITPTVEETPAEDADAAAMNRMSQASAGATDPNSEDSVARLERAAREGGQAGLLAQIQADGNLVVPAG